MRRVFSTTLYLSAFYISVLRLPDLYKVFDLGLLVAIVSVDREPALALISLKRNKLLR